MLKGSVPSIDATTGNQDPNKSVRKSVFLIHGYKKNESFYGLSNYCPAGHTFRDGTNTDYASVSNGEVFLQAQKIKDPAIRAQFITDAKGSADSARKAFDKRTGTYKAYAPDATASATTYSYGEWETKSLEVQNYINYKKYHENPDFKKAIDKYIEAHKAWEQGGRQGAMPWIAEDTAAASYRDDNWGIGPEMLGANKLGNSQVAFARALMETSNNSLKNNSSITLTDFSTDGQFHQTMQQKNAEATGTYKRDIQPVLMAAVGWSPDEIAKKTSGAQQPININAGVSYPPIKVTGDHFLGRRDNEQPTNPKTKQKIQFGTSLSQHVGNIGVDSNTKITAQTLSLASAPAPLPPAPAPQQPVQKSAIQVRKEVLACLQRDLYRPNNTGLKSDLTARCFTEHSDPKLQSITVKPTDTIYGVNINQEPYFLFDTNTQNLIDRALKAGVTLDANSVPIVRNPTSPTPSSASHSKETSDITTTRKALHEIKVSEIGDGAVRALLAHTPTLTPEMEKFLNSDNSTETRKAFNLKKYDVNDSTTHVTNVTNVNDIKNARDVFTLDRISQVAVARTATVTFDANHMLRQEAKSCIYVEGFMPRLGQGSDGCDISKFFSDSPAKQNTIGTLAWESNGKNDLKTQYKHSLLAQMQAAQAAGAVGMAINPPRAFLSGLDNNSNTKLKEEAITLWIQAANEAIKELKDPNFTLAINVDKTQLEAALDCNGGAAAAAASSSAPALEKRCDNLKMQTELTNASLDSIECAIQNKFAFAIGGHPTQPYGNGAPSSFRINDDDQFYAGDELFHRLAPDAMIADDQTYAKRVTLTETATSAPPKRRPPPPARQEDDGQQPLSSIPSWQKGVSSNCTIITTFHLNEDGWKKAFDNTKAGLEKLGFKDVTIETDTNNPSIIKYSDKQNKIFSATLEIKTDSQKNETTFTCQSKQLSYEQQFLLIATQAFCAQQQDNNIADKTSVTLLTISQRPNFNKQTEKLKADAGDIALSPDEKSAIMAYFKAGFEEVKYKGHVFLSTDNKLANTATTTVQYQPITPNAAANLVENNLGRPSKSRGATPPDELLDDSNATSNPLSPPNK
jgi:hypothetical protein